MIRADVLEHRPSHPYDLIVSVSTLEHVGWDERPRDPARALAAIEHLKSLLAGKLLVTIPAGYNLELDRAIADGSVAFSSVRAMRGCERRNSWREVDVADVRAAASLRTVLGPPPIPWPAALELERALPDVLDAQKTLGLTAYTFDHVRLSPYGRKVS